METQLLEGKKLAEKMQSEMKVRVNSLLEKGKIPGLTVLLVGEDKASQVYVRNKERQATKVGIKSEIIRLPETISEAALIEQVEQLNEDASVHGILVQLPLPKHINEQEVLRKIDYSKDVDGFHPMNMGNFLLGNASALPCTPYGIMELLKAYDISLEGKNALVIGRSNIVGKPMALMLMEKNATITIAHSKTKNLKELAQQADVLVAAIGRGHMITGEFIKPGAVVIDVGMNRDEAGKLIGDVDTASVMGIASYVTPVPGGVGPMTITMLLDQTIKKVEAE
ncbi:bifunctional methylenetetrahydrofolate dehydrogenase/methenyltetrahydrofolate cyclohydrolase FolD [Jeotgalibaca porci]|uniref:Bifunctional protein FolD n=1 Tax=Jeotgalibaca porci TaxID=1868793 RepID=A0A6G7WK77_9LACT|nr:bifunctional methylenetetrahydrofolate dehydrogenase/methenyltetrahydrofolate cyclohydrolase FolD [Jeotgalibaca porci]NLB98528.1 bifunctional methylenetetrahydrofolate dehydrogenase/methenyltetrahydrofolate cyclohydrolase FolD [Lactobacillales bacterium]QIK52617.1 bifunctional methylenetetrahydrofolate dehydrogenase/methenyltetrahydrofolate cyclohydrolase FolD [Jeotgalibaca porci]